MRQIKYLDCWIKREIDIRLTLSLCSIDQKNSTTPWDMSTIFDLFGWGNPSFLRSLINCWYEALVYLEKNWVAFTPPYFTVITMLDEQVTSDSPTPGRGISQDKEMILNLVSAESHSQCSHDSESTARILALAILYLCRISPCSASLLRAVVILVLKVSFRSSMERVNAFGIEPNISSTLHQHALHNCVPISRDRCSRWYCPSKFNPGSLSFMRIGSFLLGRTIATVFSYPYFAVSLISVTLRFSEKPTSCRFCVARHGSPLLYLSPCAHVIDSGSDMVPLPVKHEGNFQWLYQAETNATHLKHAATELDIKPLTLGIQSDELYLRYHKLKPISILCYWSHGSRSWKSTHAYLKITLRSFFLAPNDFGLLNRYWNVVKQETQKTAIKVWLVTYGSDSVTSTNLSTIFGSHMDRLWSNSSRDLITAIVLWASYISRLLLFVVKMCRGKYLPVHSGVPISIPSSPPIRLTPVSAIGIFLTGFPFASQYMMKPPGGTINYICRVCLCTPFEDCQTIVPVHAQSLWKSAACNLSKVERQVSGTQCKESNL